MKKILAFLLTLTMLLTSAAFAEGFTISDPVIVLTNDGGDINIDLTGLEICVAAGEIDGIAAFQLDLIGNGNKMLGLTANVIGSRLVFTADGLSSAYYVEIPQDAASATQNIGMADLDIDFDALMNNLVSQIEIDGDTMRIPYTAVNETLQEILPALENAEIPGVDKDQIANVVSQLVESNSGITLEGTFSQPDDNNMSGDFKGILVQNGEEAGEVMTAAFNVTDEVIEFAAEVAGQGSLAFHAEPNGEQSIAVTLAASAEGTDLTLDCSVAQTTSAEVKLVEGADDAIDIQNMTDEQTQTVSMELMGVISGLYGFFSGALGSLLAA